MSSPQDGPCSKYLDKRLESAYRIQIEGVEKENNRLNSRIAELEAEKTKPQEALAYVELIKQAKAAEVEKLRGELNEANRTRNAEIAREREKNIVLENKVLEEIEALQTRLQAAHEGMARAQQDQESLFLKLAGIIAMDPGYGLPSLRHRQLLLALAQQLGRPGKAGPGDSFEDMIVKKNVPTPPEEGKK